MVAVPFGELVSEIIRIADLGIFHLAGKFGSHRQAFTFQLEAHLVGKSHENHVSVPRQSFLVPLFRSKGTVSGVILTQFGSTIGQTLRNKFCEVFLYPFKIEFEQIWCPESSSRLHSKQHCDTYI